MPTRASTRPAARNRTGRLPALLLAVLLLFLPAAGLRADDAGLIERLKPLKTTVHGENLRVDLLFRAIGRQAGVNIFVADSIDDTITVNMDDLTLHDLFLLLVEAKRLRYSEKNNILFVEKEEDFRGPTEDSRILERLCTRYGNAAAHLDELRTKLSERGSLSLTNRGNCVLVHDTPAKVDFLKRMLAELDQPLPQVHIEARIVFSSKDAQRRLGIKWGVENFRDAAIKAQKDTAVTAVSDLPYLGTPASSNLALGIVRDSLNLGVELQALEEAKELKILSAPRILVLDGKEAEIKQGKEVPYVTETTNTVNTTFRDATLSLKVTPSILSDKYIILDVRVTNDTVDQTSTSGGSPLIDKQEITTNLFLENGVTVVIGGILSGTDNDHQAKVPGLGNVPVLGHLFKSTDKGKEESELLVFLTPTVVSGGGWNSPAEPAAPPSPDAPASPAAPAQPGEPAGNQAPQGDSSR